MVFQGRKRVDVLQHDLVFLVETFSISFLIISACAHLSHYPFSLSSRVSASQFCRRAEQFSVPGETDSVLRIPFAPRRTGAVWDAALQGSWSEHGAAPLWSGLT